MSLQENLDKLFANNNPIAQKLAGKIKNINDALASGDITPDEAKDLLNDIDVATQLAELAGDLETKIQIQKVVDALIYVIEALI